MTSVAADIVELFILSTETLKSGLNQFLSAYSTCCLFILGMMSTGFFSGIWDTQQRQISKIPLTLFEQYTSQFRDCIRPALHCAAFLCMQAKQIKRSYIQYVWIFHERWSKRQLAGCHVCCQRKLGDRSYAFIVCSVNFGDYKKKTTTVQRSV